MNNSETLENTNLAIQSKSELDETRCQSVLIDIKKKQEFVIRDYFDSRRKLRSYTKIQGGLIPHINL